MLTFYLLGCVIGFGYAIYQFTQNPHRNTLPGHFFAIIICTVLSWVTVAIIIYYTINNKGNDKKMNKKPNTKLNNHFRSQMHAEFGEVINIANDVINQRKELDMDSPDEARLKIWKLLGILVFIVGLAYIILFGGGWL